MTAVVLPLPGPVFTMIRPRRTSVMAGGLILLEAQTGGPGVPWTSHFSGRNYFPQNSGIQSLVSRCKSISVPGQTAEVFVVINTFVVLLFFLVTVPSAFSAQHVAVHPRPGF